MKECDPPTIVTANVEIAEKVDKSNVKVSDENMPFINAHPVQIEV